MFSLFSIIMASFIEDCFLTLYEYLSRILQICVMTKTADVHCLLAQNELIHFLTESKRMRLVQLMSVQKVLYEDTTCSQLA